MESSLRDNLQRLNQEKALIASGQELVAQLIQGITKRMGENFYVIYTIQYLAFCIVVIVYMQVIASIFVQSWIVNAHREHNPFLTLNNKTC